MRIRGIEAHWLLGMLLSLAEHQRSPCTVSAYNAYPEPKWTAGFQAHEPPLIIHLLNRHHWSVQPRKTVESSVRLQAFGWMKRWGRAYADAGNRTHQLSSGMSRRTLTLAYHSDAPCTTSAYNLHPEQFWSRPIESAKTQNNNNFIVTFHLFHTHTDAI
jgi:hypothetical protein